ncbi:MAG: cupin domain-containing protein [Solirubrobacteraceae bacterium]|jgi:uncharacterized cupin superfamily protein
MNLLNPSWDAELDTGTGAILRAVRLARHAGATRLAANLYELEPGAFVSPLHFHHRNEELLFVIAGTPSLRRSPRDIQDLEPGAIVAFPPGPAGQHQIGNRSNDPARVLICATDDVPEVAEQPEAEQIAVITNTGLRLLPLTPTIAAL